MNNEKLKDLAVKYMLKEKVDGDMGIYPAAIKGGPNAYEKRSDWQNGWNTAIMEHTNKECKFFDFYDNFPKEYKDALTNLLLDDVINFTDYDEKDEITLYLNMNDTFYYSCGDTELVKTEQLNEVYDVYSHFGLDGLDAWASHQRGKDVIEPRRTEQYKKAKYYLHAILDK